MRLMRWMITGIATLVLALQPLVAEAVTLNTYLEGVDQVLLLYNVRDIGRDSPTTHQVVEVIEEGQHRMILFRYDRATKLVQKLDTLDLPPLAEGHLENQSCLVNDQLDGEVIALFETADQPGPLLLQPQKAWRASRKTERFEPIANLDEISCYQRFENE